MEREEASQLPIVIHRYMQVDRGREKAGMPCSSPNFGKCPAPSKGVTYIRMPAVVNGQRPQSRQPKHLASRQESPPNRMSLKCQPKPISLHGADKRIVALSSLFGATHLPGG
jgi:hypothetical protein